MKPTQLPSGDWWTVQETAAYLKVSKIHVYSLFNGSKLSGKKMGTGTTSPIRISAVSVEKYMESK